MTETTKPATPVGTVRELRSFRSAAGLISSLNTSLSTRVQAEQRSARRCRLVEHLRDCGDRPVLEALIAVANGSPLDRVLEDFGRLSPEVYRSVGADEFLPLRMIGGGR